MGIPQPATGRLTPVYTEEVDAKCAAALSALKQIYVPHGKHQSIRSNINTLRLSSNEYLRCGEPVEGRALVQDTGAGKTTILKMIADDANTKPGVDGKINPNRIIYIEMKVAGTLNMLCRRILKRVGDPHWNDGNADDVRERLEIAFAQMAVELLIVDEVQHLKGTSRDKLAIADELKGLLDAGIVPIVFAGTKKSEEFFQDNLELAGRLGASLDLAPMTTSTGDRRMFREFCRDLDNAISKAGIFEQSVEIAIRENLTGLIRASGGHFGRVCRLVAVAVEHAVRREALFVEQYDLHAAVEAFALPNKYCSENPFFKTKNA